MTEAFVSLVPESPASRQLQAVYPLAELEDIKRVAAEQQRKPVYVVESLNANSVAFMACVHHIAQLRRADGRALSPNLQVVEAVRELRGNVIAGNDVTITLEHQKRDGGVLSITADTRKVAMDGILQRRWVVSAFAQHEVVQRYEETIAIPATPGFEQAELMQARALQPQDVVHLQRLVMAACMPETDERAPWLAAVAD